MRGIWDVRDTWDVNGEEHEGPDGIGAGEIL